MIAVYALGCLGCLELFRCKIALVGVIWLNGKDINLEVIKAGLAWHYKQYQREQSAQDRMLYAYTALGMAEATARKTL